jgi:hypothetical protein
MYKEVVAVVQFISLLQIINSSYTVLLLLQASLLANFCVDSIAVESTSDIVLALQLNEVQRYVCLALESALLLGYCQ